MRATRNPESRISTRGWRSTLLGSGGGNLISKEQNKHVLAPITRLLIISLSSFPRPFVLPLLVSVFRVGSIVFLHFVC
jgi:hypothetical protein